MKQFTIPFTYRSQIINSVKQQRREDDKLKKDFRPSRLTMGNLEIYLARHFGFCYGVENAIEIAFRTVDENPGKRIYLLSEMIHNPQVNRDLQERGVQFLQDTYGNKIIGFEELTADDIVLIPAFGTTREIEEQLHSLGIRTEKYNTTCPFVEKVWNRSEQIAKKNYTVVVHGKPNHEETRATFSHAAENGPTLVIKDMAEAILLAEFINGQKNPDEFFDTFNGRYSAGFDPKKDLQRIGVVNQTTMLSSETQAIADYLKIKMVDKYELDSDNAAERFADTRDTLCYATNDNQSAVYGLLEQPADFAIVVGGYNSSNTSHLVELCEERLPTYFITNEKNILSREEIRHFDLHNHEEKITSNYLPETGKTRILITSGASCPDAIVEAVIARIAEVCGEEDAFEKLSKDLVFS